MKQASLKRRRSEEDPAASLLRSEETSDIQVKAVSVAIPRHTHTQVLERFLPKNIQRKQDKAAPILLVRGQG